MRHCPSSISRTFACYSIQRIARAHPGEEPDPLCHKHPAQMYLFRVTLHLHTIGSTSTLHRCDTLQRPTLQGCDGRNGAFVACNSRSPAGMVRAWGLTSFLQRERCGPGGNPGIPHTPRHRHRVRGPRVSKRSAEDHARTPGGTLLAFCLNDARRGGRWQE